VTCLLTRDQSSKQVASRGKETRPPNPVLRKRRNEVSETAKGAETRSLTASVTVPGFSHQNHFDRCKHYARQVHIRLRKGTQVPYMAHLFGVASLVLGDVSDPDL
jgi:hypothetical protein